MADAADCPLVLKRGMFHCPHCNARFPRFVRRTCPVLSKQSQTAEAAHQRRNAVAANRLGVSLADIVHYGQSILKWTAAGFPERSDTEVGRLLAVCQVCAHYTEGRCRKCGCRVSKAMAVVNKIRMETEKCPVGKW